MAADLHAAINNTTVFIKITHLAFCQYLIYAIAKARKTATVGHYFIKYC